MNTAGIQKDQLHLLGKLLHYFPEKCVKKADEPLSFNTKKKQ